jgi:hypothetical protein
LAHLERHDAFHAAMFRLADGPRKEKQDRDRRIVTKCSGDYQRYASWVVSLFVVQASRLLDASEATTPQFGKSGHDGWHDRQMGKFPLRKSSRGCAPHDTLCALWR